MPMDNQDSVKFNTDILATELSRVLRFRNEDQKILNPVMSICVAMSAI